MPRWLIPAAYFFVSLVGAELIPRLEFALMPAWGNEISVSTAQALLGAASSGMMAFTAIVFSIGFLFIQYTATAFSKRFMVMAAQGSLMFHAFGLFVSTFTFALATLAFVNRQGSNWVPFGSILIVGVLLVLSVIVMALLMNQVASLRITRVLSFIGDRGRAAIEGMPDNASDRTPAQIALDDTLQTIVYSGNLMVLAAIDRAALVLLACKSGTTIRLEYAIGDTVYPDSALARVHGTGARIDEPELLRAIRLAPENLFAGDVRFALRLLVDTAIMALSPAVNDPTTAVEALDEILDLMLRLGRRRLDSGCVFDESGALRLIYPAPTWNDYLTLAFDEIRSYGGESVQVVRRMRAALVRLAGALRDESRREAVVAYHNRLDAAIKRLGLDEAGTATALGIDPQGLGLTRV
ncbi:MAG: DUF2254 domain-containing protein [Candidatus Eremiobacteraeota bacterium]|nr:DUF2254 domain-containing protein [Candidatus Eremiobacteraeota bacterium]